MKRLLQPESLRLALVQTAIRVLRQAESWLGSGLDPRQLAFTLALGFAIGCIPLLGLTTGICALAALALRLNMPAIQAANWVAMPVQVVLLVPFLRLGHWLFAGRSAAFAPGMVMARVQTAPLHTLLQMSGLFAHGVVAWMLTAGPALVPMTILLTVALNRIPARSVASVEEEAQELPDEPYAKAS